MYIICLLISAIDRALTVSIPLTLSAVAVRSCIGCSFVLALTHTLSLSLSLSSLLFSPVRLQISSSRHLVVRGCLVATKVEVAYLSLPYIVMKMTTPLETLTLTFSLPQGARNIEGTSTFGFSTVTCILYAILYSYHFHVLHLMKHYRL